jgi:hypothetical protein
MLSWLAGVSPAQKRANAATPLDAVKQRLVWRIIAPCLGFAALNDSRALPIERERQFQVVLTLVFPNCCIQIAPTNFAQIFLTLGLNQHNATPTKPRRLAQRVARQSIRVLAQTARLLLLLLLFQVREWLN